MDNLIEKHFSTAGTEEGGAEIVAALWQSWDEASCSLSTEISCSTFQLPVCEDELMEYMPLEKAVLQVDSLFQVLRASVTRDADGRTVNVGPLYPVVTEGDGDCLLHATSLAMFGRHDRGQVFRQMLALVMTSETHADIIKQLWVAGEKVQDEALGIERNANILDEEYAALVAMTTMSKEYLAAFHIFCLANVLRRPIIVFADLYLRTQSGTPFSPMSMRGVYLPLLIDPRRCCKQPIMLVYTVAKVGAAGHFTAVIGMQGHTSHAQLFDEGGVMLPIPYSDASSDTEKEQQLHLYLNTKLVTIDAESGHTGLVAHLPPVTRMLPSVQRMRERYLLEVIQRVDNYREWLRQQLDFTNRQEELLRKRLDRERREMARLEARKDTGGQLQIQIPSQSSNDDASATSLWSPIGRDKQRRQQPDLHGRALQRLEAIQPAVPYKHSANDRTPPFVSRRGNGQQAEKTNFQAFRDDPFSRY